MQLGTSRNGVVAAYPGLSNVQRKSLLLHTLEMTEKEVLWGNEWVLLFSIMVDLFFKHESMARDVPCHE